MPQEAAGSSLPPASESASESASENDQTVVTGAGALPVSDAYSGLAPRELGQALIGQQLGVVKLEHFIGGGGMGAVFKGLDTRLNRTVAIKVLSTHGDMGEDNVRRFMVEAQSAARLDHINIARVYNEGEDRGLRYIVFEYVDGENIRDLVLQHGPMSIPNAVGYAVQVTQALKHAWRREVVHRDIKPSNILITVGGRAKLVDMGLARLGEQDNDLTTSGTTLGTFDYIAPEQARDPRLADTRSDIYSLGCTLFYMLAGRPPFPKGTALQKLLQHQGDEPPNLQEARGDTPPALAAIVSRMLAKRPQDRYQTPSELLDALMVVAKPLGVSPVGTPSEEPIPLAEPAISPWRLHAPWLIAAAIVVAAVMLLPLASTPVVPPPVGFEEISPPVDDNASDGNILENRNGLDTEL